MKYLHCLILETHLYGVDLDPQAAEIAVVNLMMRAMERRHREKRLPLILNQNVKVGNSLIGVKADDPRMSAHAAAIERIRALRTALVRTPSGAEHDAIIHDLAAATRELTGTLDTDFAAHFNDLERVRPFHWGAEFPEVFFAVDGTPKTNPGFAIIIGYPPWEILKPDLREFYAQFDPLIESRYTRTQVEARIADLQAEEPHRQADFEAQSVTIEQTAAYVRQAADFTRQGRGDTATHKLFLKRMYSLLQNGGRIGYVVPSGIYTDLGTKNAGLWKTELNRCPAPRFV